MSKQVPFHIKSGIPFEKSIVVTLPNGRSWWTADGDFEVLSQIREAEDYESPLLLDLTQFLTMTFVPGTDPDEVTIDLVMTGANTRLLKKSGYYDIILSDPFAVDEKAFVVIGGPVHRTSTVTGDAEEVTL